MNEVQTRIKAAEWYVDRGFRAGTAWGTLPDGTCRCPKGAACDQKPGKHPVSPHGFHDATSDQATINKLLSVASSPNLLVVPPPGCFGWDLDGNDAVRIRDLEGTLGPLPPTLGHQTPNGRHVVYRWPEGVQRPSKVLGVVTRWGGDNGEASGYLIGAGSRIGDKSYRVLRGQDGRPLEVADLAEAWVTAALAAATTKPAGGEFGPGYRLPERVETNDRYFAVRDYVASRWRPNITEAELWLGVRDVLAPTFVEPKPERELRADFGRAMKDIDRPRGDKWDPKTRAAPPITINTTPVGPFPEFEDFGSLEPSELAETEYVEDLIRPGRIHLVAAEEGAGKSYAIDADLGIRVALAGGEFAGTWKILQTGPVVVLSEMHPDDDIARGDRVSSALGYTRADLTGRYFRLPLYTAANGAPCLSVPAWRDWFVGRCRDEKALVAIFDTVTGAVDVDPWGREIQKVFRELRAMLDKYPDLAIVLIVHLKKPTGHGTRRLSDVLGEYGRWADVVVLMESSGTDQTRIEVRKRVRRERRIVATRRDGLLVEPRDAEASGPKVPAKDVIAAVAAQPGMSYAELGAALDVSKDTASNYVKALKGQLDSRPTGPKGAHRVFLTAEPPNSAEREGFGRPSAVSTAVEAVDRRTAEPPYIVRRSASAVGGPAVYPESDGAVDDGDLVAAARSIFGDMLKDGSA